MELLTACILKASLKSTLLGPEMDKAGTRDVSQAWEALWRMGRMGSWHPSCRGLNTVALPLYGDGDGEVKKKIYDQ